MIKDSIKKKGVVFIITALIITMLPINGWMEPVHANTNRATDSDALVNGSETTGKIKAAGGANIRESYDVNSRKVGLLPEGSSFKINEVKFTSQSNNSSASMWYKIETSSLTGYVRGDLISVWHSGYSQAQTVDDVNLRKGAGTDFTLIKTLSKGTKVRIALVAYTSGGDKWYKVNYNGTFGYVHSPYLSEVVSEITNDMERTNAEVISGTTGKIKAVGGANIRESYDTNSRKVGELPQDGSFTIAEVRFTNKSNTSSEYTWYKIKSSSVAGYVRGDLISVWHGGYADGETAGSVNLRKGAGTGFSSIKTLSKGTKVKVALVAYTSGGDKWYKVNYNGTFGYIYAEYATLGNTQEPPKEPGASGTTGKIKAVGGANIRESYDTNSRKVGELPQGGSFTIAEVRFTNKSNTSSKYTWYKIKSSSVAGYVRGDLISVWHGGYADGETAGSVNLRKGAGTGFSSIKTLSKGTKVKVALVAYTSGGDKWYKVNYNGTFGYIYAEYATLGNTQEPPKEPEITGPVIGTITAKSGGNVRKDYSANSEKVGHLELNSKVKVLDVKFTSQSNDAREYTWYKIETSSMTGYIRGDLLSIRHNSYTSVKTLGGVSMRTGAGMGFKLLKTIPAKTSVQVGLNAYTIDGDKWYKINYDGTFGYIYAGYATTGSADAKPPVSVFGTTGVVKSLTRLMSSCSLDSDVIDEISSNTEVTLSEVRYTKNSSTDTTVWYKAKTKTKTGYIRSDAISVWHGEYTDGSTIGSVKVRTGPGENFSEMKTIPGNSGVQIAMNAVSPEGEQWYKIKYDTGKFGYVFAQYISVNAFENSLIEQGFPASYVKPLMELHNQYPNWKFKAKHVGFSWASALAEQCSNSWANTIPSNWGDGYILDYAPADGPGWVRASKKAVGYYMDPRNWMEADSIFMFEAQEYNATIHKESAVKALLAPTALPSSASAYYMEAARKYNINPLYLAAKTQVELGPYSFMVDGHSFTIGSSLGYVSADYVNETQSSYTRGWVEKAGGINLRSSASTSSDNNIIGVLEKGSNFTVLEMKHTSKTSIEKENVWYKIKTSKGTIGYVRSDVVKAVHDTYGAGKITGDGVNYRTGPGTSFDRITSFSDGTVLKLASKVSAADGSKWYKIKYGNTTTFSSCYNVFNIGASDSAAGNAATNGLIYAAGGTNQNETSYGRPWNTLNKAVLGGTQFIKEGFIDNKQYTPYYERFNVLNGLRNVGTHQYATASFYAATQGNVIYNRYKDIGLLNQGFVFEIPVYSSTPSTVSPRP